MARGVKGGGGAEEGQLEKWRRKARVVGRNRRRRRKNEKVGDGEKLERGQNEWSKRSIKEKRDDEEKERCRNKPRESQDYKRKVNIDRTEKQTASSPTCRVVKEKKDKQRESLADSHVNF